MLDITVFFVCFCFSSLQPNKVITVSNTHRDIIHVEITFALCCLCENLQVAAFTQMHKYRLEPYLHVVTVDLYSFLPAHPVQIRWVD